MRSAALLESPVFLHRNFVKPGVIAVMLPGRKLINPNPYLYDCIIKESKVRKL